MQLPLNVSPVSASFFGQERQGIHLVLSVACSFLLIICVFSFPLQQRIGSGAWKRSSSASLLLYGKIEEKNDSVVYVQSVGPPTPGEWKTALAVV
jgi:hypothetical protein